MKPENIYLFVLIRVVIRDIRVKSFSAFAVTASIIY